MLAYANTINWGYLDSGIKKKSILNILCIYGAKSIEVIHQYSTGNGTN